MNIKWVRAALIQNLPKAITQHLAVQLRQAQIIDSIYNLVMIYLHDHNIGLPRGQIPAKLYLTEDSKEETNQTKHQEDKPEDSIQEQPQGPWTNTYGDGPGDVNVVKGGNKGGRMKGYGQCWHCGGWGHPRRECPQLAGAYKGSVNASKGKGKGFKGGKGTGFKGGKGKGSKGNSWQYKGGYRSPGKPSEKTSITIAMKSTMMLGDTTYTIMNTDTMAMNGDTIPMVMASSVI